MKRQTLSGFCVMAVLAVALAAPAGAAAPPRSDGLVRIDSRTLDEVYVRPDANFQGYRKVIVDPGVVTMQKGWLKSINATRGPSRWLVPEDVQNITDQAAVDLSEAIARTFRAHSYEVVTTPAPGVLRITAHVTDLSINAPGVTSANIQALFNVTAGEATLTMDVRDAATGQLLGQVVDRGTAHELSNRINRAFTVTNAFWFDALFSRWTTTVIASLESAKP
jgi:hypothetical protein